MYTVLITGANRGIGLEFVRQYAQKGYQVFATYLPLLGSQELQKIRNQYPFVTLYPLDISKEADVVALSTRLKDHAIDILINNAGIRYDNETRNAVTGDMFMHSFSINSMGAFLMSRSFLSHIARSTLKIIVSLSSNIGSIEHNLIISAHSVDAYAYTCTKAALNMLMSTFALETEGLGIKVLLLSPGLVSTSMGNKVAGPKITPTTSVTGMRECIRYAIQSPINQLFYNYDNTLVPW